MNGRTLLLALMLCLAAADGLTAAAPAPSGRIFYLVEDDAGVSVESLVIADGETKILMDEKILSYIIPFGPGSKSGDLSRTSDRGRPISVCCRNNRIESSIRNPDGSLLRDLPAIDLDEVQRLDVRVNVTAGNGTQSAYRILGWDSVVADGGPVLDMFAGKIPMEPGDYSIMVETLAGAEKPDLHGAVPLVAIDHWLTADAVLADGRKIRLLLDLGATTSVLDSRALPDGSEVTPYRMVEYSDKGRQVSDVLIPGAGGMTPNISGTAGLAAVHLGDLVLDELPVVVIERFPEKIAEKGLDGILGIDQLRRAGRLLITPSPEGKGRTLLLGDRIGRLPPPDHEIPFNEADNKLFFKGMVNGAPVDFILDSGAAQSVLDPSISERVTIPFRASREGLTGAGLDGTPMAMREVIAGELSLGGCRLEHFPLLLSELDVLNGLGIGESAGLLGADFFSRFERIEIDFSIKAMRLWDRPGDDQAP